MGEDCVHSIYDEHGGFYDHVPPSASRWLMPGPAGISNTQARWPSSPVPVAGTQTLPGLWPSPGRFTGISRQAKWLDISELNTRAGYRPGFGYVDPAEAADEILDEALQPFLDDLQRRAGLGMASAAAEVAAGIILGLYNCREASSESLLEYAPDYAAERASVVVDDCARLGIELPAEFLELMPGWSNLLAWS